MEGLFDPQITVHFNNEANNPLGASLDECQPSQPTADRVVGYGALSRGKIQCPSRTAEPACQHISASPRIADPGLFFLDLGMETRWQRISQNIRWILLKRNSLLRAYHQLTGTRCSLSTSCETPIPGPVRTILIKSSYK